MNINGKTLYRSRNNRIISGVCGGLGEFFEVDANLVRLITVIVACMAGVGVVAYIAAAILLPEN